MPPLQQRLAALVPSNRMRNAVGHALWPVWKWTKFGQVGVVMDTKHARPPTMWTCRMSRSNSTAPRWNGRWRLKPAPGSWLASAFASPKS